jgi:hypothetical protein
MLDAMALRVLLAAPVGWLDRRQQGAVAYLNLRKPHPSWMRARPDPASPMKNAVVWLSTGIG